MKSPFNIKEKLSSLSESLKETKKFNPFEEVRDALEHASIIIQKENEFLKEFKIEEATKLYENKKEAFNRIESVLLKVKNETDIDFKLLLENTKETEEKFQNALKENKDILKSSIVAQNEVTRILIEEARSISEKVGSYDRLGKINHQ